jgi:RNA polymerase sigma-70 factor, ECF subfamily
MALNLEALTEAQLVTLAQGGNGDAFAELIRRTKSSSLRTAQLILKDADAAQDQLQSAYLNAWKQIHNFRNEAKFATWMGRIVTNQCLMALRSRRNAPFQMAPATDDPELMPDFADDSPSVETDFALEQERALVRRELRCVPPFLRKAIDMVYFSDIPIADAAAELGVSVPAFKSRLSRARAFMKQRLAKHYEPSAEAL